MGALAGSQEAGGVRILSSYPADVEAVEGLAARLTLGGLWCIGWYSTVCVALIYYYGLNPRSMRCLSYMCVGLFITDSFQLLVCQFMIPIEVGNLLVC